MRRRLLAAALLLALPLAAARCAEAPPEEAEETDSMPLPVETPPAATPPEPVPATPPAPEEEPASAGAEVPEQPPAPTAPIVAPSPQPSNPPPMAAPAPSAPGAGGLPSVTVGDYLFAGGREGEGLGAYGYLVFTERPADAADTARYEGVCEAFKAGLLPPRDVPPGTPPRDLAVTYWPVDTVAPTDPREAYGCPLLVRRYGYGIANRLAVRVGKAHVRGPILVALPSAQSGPLPPGTPVLVIDASDVSGRFRRLFAVWRDHITDDPARWRVDPGGFRAATAIVALLEEFGPQVLSLLQLP